MRNRVAQFVLVASVLWSSWLLMMLVHELGHVIGAACAGGRVIRVLWHPAVISRTDVLPNPHPLIEIAAGPIFGSLAPLLIAYALRRSAIRNVMWTFAGFCLIANGVYIGIAAIRPVGDAKQLVGLGTPSWLLGSCGVVASISGFGIWHTVSPAFGFGPSKRAIPPRTALRALAIAGAMTLIAWIAGNRGG